MALSTRTRTRRAILTTAALAGGAALLASVSGKPEGELDLSTLRRPGDPDDDAAFRRALATGRPIHAPAGKGSGQGGRYVLGSSDRDTLPSGLSLRGDGLGRTIFAIAHDHPFLLHCDSKSADPAKNIRGLRFADLTFESDVARRGFSEFEYLVMLNGVTDVRFDRVGFRGFRGDGLHLGSSTVLGVERHNERVTVADCVFDGVNANNRNAISVIDATDLVIERSSFLDCTRTGDGTANAGDPFDPKTGLGMPGPIDIEPNPGAFVRVRRVIVRNNRFRGGGGYAVALHPLPNSDVKVPQGDFQVIDNVIEGRVGGIDMTGYSADYAMKGGPGYGVLLRGNLVRRCETPFRLSGVRGLAMTGNRFLDCTLRGEINNNAAVADVQVRDNLFERIGSNDFPYGLWLRDGDDIMITGNSFTDCGGPRGDGCAIAIVAGSPRRLTIANNRFTSPEHRMSKALLVFRDASVDRRQLTVAGNQIAAGMMSVEAALGR